MKRQQRTEWMNEWTLKNDAHLLGNVVVSEQCWHQQKKPVKEETTQQAKKNNKFCELFFCYYFLFGLWFLFAFVCHIWIPLNKHKKAYTQTHNRNTTNVNQFPCYNHRSPHGALSKLYFYFLSKFVIAFHFADRVSPLWICLSSHCGTANTNQSPPHGIHT